VTQPPLGSDFSLNGVVPHRHLSAAAVLVPLVRREPESPCCDPAHDDMPSHAARLPSGGRRQAEDADAVATALRETEKKSAWRDVLSRSSARSIITDGTGYEITPIVGIVTPGFTTMQIRARWPTFRGAAGALPRRENHRIDSRIAQGRERRFYAMPYGER